MPSKRGYRGISVMAVHTERVVADIRDRPIIVGALMVAMALAALDQTIPSTALPMIYSEFDELKPQCWIITAYLLAMIATVVAWGRFSDRFGRKPLLMIALAGFLTGSALCGLAWNLNTLIAFRTVQGAGAGGILVLTLGVVRDLASPRDRGRYQGVFGAIYGVCSVVGPVLGGFFVDHLSWRWIFFVNLPIGMILLAVLSIALWNRGAQDRHTMNSLSLALLAVGICLVLLTIVGVIRYHWPAGQIMLTGGAAVMIGAFWWIVERRAPEPLLPARLFRCPVFSVGVALDFVVGFIVFGSLVYLPAFLQIVSGVSAAVSGVYLLPLVVPLLGMQFLVGRLISARRTYRIHAVVGMAVTMAGLFLLSRIEPFTVEPTVSLSLCLLGLGLGMVAQVPVIAVQNAVPYRDLGAATSAVMLFRAVGALLGITVFNVAFSHHLSVSVARALSGVRPPQGFDPESIQRNPKALYDLGPDQRAQFIQAYTESFQTMFRYAIPVAFLGLLLGLLLREVRLRATAGNSDLGQCLGGAPTVPSSHSEIQRLLFQLLRRDERAKEQVKDVYRGLGARDGTACSAAGMWMLCRLSRAGSMLAEDLEEQAGELGRPAGSIVDQLVAQGLAHRSDGKVEISEAGLAATRRMHESMRRVLAGLLEGWSPDDDPELLELLVRLSREFPGDVEDLPIVT